MSTPTNETIAERRAHILLEQENRLRAEAEEKRREEERRLAEEAVIGLVSAYARILQFQPIIFAY